LKLYLLYKIQLYSQIFDFTAHSVKPAIEKVQY